MPLLLRQPRTSQPQGPAQIVAPVGLIPITVYAGGAALVDIVCGKPFVRGSAVSVVPSIVGIGAKQAAANTGLTQTGRVYPADNQGYTAIWSGVLLGAASGSTPKLIGIANSNVSQSADVFGLELNSSTDFGINFKANSTNGSRTIANAVPAAGPCTIVAVYDVAAEVCRVHVYSAGKVLSFISSAISGASAPTITGSEVFCLGPDVIEASSRYVNATVVLGALFAGVAGAKIETKIAANPWQIFAPQSRQIWVPASAGGAATVTSDTSAAYSIRESVASDTSPAYLLRTNALADASASYDIRAAITSDTSAAYDILTAGAVTSDCAASYGIQAAVQSDASIAYEMRGAVQSTASAGYEIRSAIVKDASTAYALRGAIESDLAASYAVLALTAVSSDLVGAYAVTGLAGLSEADIAAIWAYATRTLTAGPTAESIADAVLAAAQSAPIHADIRKVRGQSIAGSGSEADPWGP